MQKLKNWMLQEGWVFALEFALIAALAIALAHWTWVALTPSATAASGVSFEAENYRPGAIAQRRLFGAAQARAADGDAAAGSTLRLKLLGVFSREDPAAGRAILALDNGRPATVMAGEAIGAGVVLKEVHPDHVLVNRGGVAERVNLERRTVVFEAKPGAPRPAPK